MSHENRLLFFLQQTLRLYFLFINVCLLIFETIEDGDNYEEKTGKLTWFAASEIFVTTKMISKEVDPDESININISDINLRLLNLDKTVLKLESDKHDNIIKAESQHSDLIPAIYEGILFIFHQ